MSNEMEIFSYSQFVRSKNIPSVSSNYAALDRENETVSKSVIRKFILKSFGIVQCFDLCD